MVFFTSLFLPISFYLVLLFLIVIEKWKVKEHTAWNPYHFVVMSDCAGFYVLHNTNSFAIWSSLRFHLISSDCFCASFSSFHFMTTNFPHSKWHIYVFFFVWNLSFSTFWLGSFSFAKRLIKVHIALKLFGFLLLLMQSPNFVHNLFLRVSNLFSNNPSQMREKPQWWSKWHAFFLLLFLF